MLLSFFACRVDASPKISFQAGWIVVSLSATHPNKRSLNRPFKMHQSTAKKKKKKKKSLLQIIAGFANHNSALVIKGLVSLRGCERAWHHHLEHHQDRPGRLRPTVKAGVRRHTFFVDHLPACFGAHHHPQQLVKWSPQARPRAHPDHRHTPRRRFGGR